MKRPNMKDDPNYPFEYPDTYMGGLENYCDYLEQEIKHLNRFIDDRQSETSTIIDVYEKALDKACEVLEEGYGEEYACYIYMVDCDNGIKIPSHMDKEQWKAWLMKDE